RAAPLPAMRAAGTGRGRSAGRSAATVGRGASRTSFERDARRQAGRSLAETKEQTREGDSGCRWPTGELSMGQLRLARFEDQVTARQPFAPWSKRRSQVRRELFVEHEPEQRAASVPIKHLDASAVALGHELDHVEAQAESLARAALLGLPRAELLYHADI